MTVRASKARRLTPKQAMRELYSVYRFADCLVQDGFSGHAELKRVYDRLDAAATRLGVREDSVIVAMLTDVALCRMDRVCVRALKCREYGIAL